MQYTEYIAYYIIYNICKEILTKNQKQEKKLTVDRKGNGIEQLTEHIMENLHRNSELTILLLA